MLDDVRAAPLVDGLLVVADHAQLHLRAGQQLDQPLLGRVDVLVLVHDQVPQPGVDLGGQLRALQLPYRPHDLLAVGKQPVAIEGLVVGAQHRPERVGHRSRVEQLVLDHVDALEERGDRGEQAVARVELPDAEPVRLPGQERGELVVVQHVVGLVPGHPLLEQPEAERVDRADEQPGQPVQRRRAEPVFHPVGDPVLQLLGGPLGERERHDRLGRQALGEQVRHPLRDHLGLARSGGSDDLKVTAPVADGIARRAGQFRRWRTIPVRWHIPHCRAHEPAIEAESIATPVDKPPEGR